MREALVPGKVSELGKRSVPPAFGQRPRRSVFPRLFTLGSDLASTCSLGFPTALGRTELR
jgi:hypothetical protein